MTSAIYDQKGKKTTEKVKISDNIFGIKELNHTVLKEAYLAHLANRRDNYAQTKTRGLVSGGGRKPWRQKGLGKARFGSTRNPIWRGGGIAFGPTGYENFSRKINIKTKRLAIRLALSDKYQNKNIVIVNDIDFKSISIKNGLNLISNLDLKGNILLVVQTHSQNLDLAFRNIPNVKIVSARYINAFNLLNADNIVLEKSVLGILNQWLDSSKEQIDE